MNFETVNGEALVKEMADNLGGLLEKKMKALEVRPHLGFSLLILLNYYVCSRGFRKILSILELEKLKNIFVRLNMTF